MSTPSNMLEVTIRNLTSEELIRYASSSDDPFVERLSDAYQQLLYEINELEEELGNLELKNDDLEFENENLSVENDRMKTLLIKAQKEIYDLINY